MGVADGSLSIGDTVLFVTMINQLYVPLTFFGSYYRQVSGRKILVADMTLLLPSPPPHFTRPPQVQKALIDMENMFELLGTKTQVQDPPGGAQLQVMGVRGDN